MLIKRRYIQRGGGRGFTPFTPRRYLQRGTGIGSFLVSMASKVIPFVKKLFSSSVGQTIIKGSKIAAKSAVGQNIIKNTKKELKNTGLNLAKDIALGNNIKEGLQKSLKKSKNKIISSAFDTVTKKPIKNKRKLQTYHMKTIPRKKKAKRNQDLFDDFA